MVKWYWTDLLPITYCALTIVGYSSLLLVSWVNCHLSLYKFPKISHLGAAQPELQFFAFLCILQAISFSGTVHYVFYVWKLIVPKHKLILPAYWMGMLSAAGLVIIGCFQVNEASDIHFSGAVLCFILGGFYFIITTLVTCALKNKDNYFHHIFRWRLCLTVGILAGMVAMVLTMSVKQHIYNIDPQTPTTEEVEGCQNISYTKMSDNYYQWELYSSLSEWISCGIYLLYFYSYRHEVKLIARATTSIAIKSDMKFASIVTNNLTKYDRHGWAPFDDQDNEGTGSLLSNESADGDEAALS